ncbi:MAG: hypothetical protein K2I73_06080 [Eubacterium sp.]|nr:hypothetical protein [Eubacterium sp.]
MDSEKLLSAIGNIDDKLIEETLNRNAKKRIKFSKGKKITAILVAAIIVLAGSISVMAKSSVENWSYHIGKDVVQEGINGIPIEKIPDIKDKALLSADKIKSTFNISFITSEKMNNNEYVYFPTIEDDTIMIVDFWNATAYQQGDKEIHVSARIWSQNATENYNIGNDDLDAAGNKTVLESYHINQLDCDAVVYTCPGLFADSTTRTVADILYENVSYNFDFDNFTLDEVKEVLDTLHV